MQNADAYSAVVPPATKAGCRSQIAERNGTNQRKTAICLILALIVSAALRFIDLGQKPLWCDELATLQRLSLPLSEHLGQMSGNHPLYELLLRLWMPPDASDAWMRIPSAALGVLAVWLTWKLVRGVGRWEGLIAAWLMALSPLHLMYSRIGRAYSLACTLALASNLAFIWALRRRNALSFAAYVLATALMVYANLIAASVWMAQALFLLWFYLPAVAPGPLKRWRGQMAKAGRRRLRRIGYWLFANVAVAALLAPWMLFNVRNAVVWSVETKYTPQQLGTWAKACYLALTLCLGETVHPLNLWVVLPAFLGFGAAMAFGILRVLRRRGLVRRSPWMPKPWRRRLGEGGRLGLFLLIQLVVLFVAGLCFAAVAPKHLTILLPAWCGLLAIGIFRFRMPRNDRGLKPVPQSPGKPHSLWRRLQPATLPLCGLSTWICGGFMLATTAASLFNYFTNRQFADADMVTPWREIAATIERSSGPHDVIIVGYRPDRGMYYMFRRYYRGKLEVQYLDFSDWRGYLSRSGRGGAIWLLLHDGDPWRDIERWLGERKLAFEMIPFQEEEHTLKWLRAGLREREKYRSPLYRLYRISSGEN